MAISTPPLPTLKFSTALQPKMAMPKQNLSITYGRGACTRVPDESNLLAMLRVQVATIAVATHWFGILKHKIRQVLVEPL